VTKSGNSFKVELIEDVLEADEVEQINDDHSLRLDTGQEWHASLRIAVELLGEAERNKKHLLFYVHGYNNDLKDIVETAREVEEAYNVLVLVFSWPSNGGGSASGTLAYLSDKDDARVSATAFNRFAEKIRSYHELISRSREQALLDEARKKHPDNHAKAQELVTRLINEQCHVSLNLLCHSMGNYLLKYALMPSNSTFRRMIFDNICLVAADANNESHANWVDKMDFRTRLYIVINENDFALAWSRRKPGEEQKVRLGHSLDVLNAQNAKYVNVTEADWVNNSHSYFNGEPVEKNLRLQSFFADLFEGRVAENNTDVNLRFRPELNAYEL
jgi:esterase/lipase superfamily enzyme